MIQVAILGGMQTYCGLVRLRSSVATCTARVFDRRRESKSSAYKFLDGPPSFLRLPVSLRIPREHVNFDIDRIASGEGTQIRGGVGVRNDSDCHAVPGDPRNSEADSLYRNRAFLDHVARERFGNFN